MNRVALLALKILPGWSEYNYSSKRTDVTRFRFKTKIIFSENKQLCLSRYFPRDVHFFKKFLNFL